MSVPVSRLRMFTDPNGSGKSTIKSVVSSALLGVHINPDEIEDEIRRTGNLNLELHRVSTTEEEIAAFVAGSPLAQNRPFPETAIHCLRLLEGRLGLGTAPLNSYLPSSIADFLRQKLLQQRISFTFETVVSSPDEVLMLNTMQKLGYRTYLHYLATGDSIIDMKARSPMVP